MSSGQETAHPEVTLVSVTLAAGVQISMATLKTPIGVLQITASADSVLYIDLPGQHVVRLEDSALRSRLLSRTRTPALRAALAELREYFAGQRRRFDVPVAPGGTEFQRRVWQAICEIPFGETVSYSHLAERLGGPLRTRAVGAATGANPIPIIIPCHRVVGADGSMTGYGGGLKMKVWLLQHEGALLA
jgi:methylated-DNA-[protein]-cysteine S-methyltransferase